MSYSEYCKGIGGKTVMAVGNHSFSSVFFIYFSFLFEFNSLISSTSKFDIRKQPYSLLPTLDIVLFKVNDIRTAVATSCLDQPWIASSGPLHIPDAPSPWSEHVGGQ